MPAITVRAAGHSLAACGVHVTAHFNDQACLVTVKIDDVRFNDLLAAEVKALQAVGAQPRPKQPFCGGHLAAQFAGALRLDAGDVLAGDDWLFWHSYYLPLTPS